MIVRHERDKYHPNLLPSCGLMYPMFTQAFWILGERFVPYSKK